MKRIRSIGITNPRTSCLYIRLLIIGIFVSFSYHYSFAQAPFPVACYNFSGNLNEANGGTSLIEINGAGTYSDSASVCGTDSVYNWAIDHGLDLSIGNVFPVNNYTIEFLFKFTTTPYPRSWQRIINFKNSTSDDGLYSYGSGTNYNLQVYPESPGTSNMAVPNHWLHLFLTRDSLSGVVNGYINDSLQISFVDNSSLAVFISDLILFKDDNVVPGEESAGSIDYLRIYAQPLTHAQISYIVNIAQPVASINGNLNICPGDSTMLSATGADNYVWNDGETTASIFVSPSSAASYSVIGWSDIFCTKSCLTYDTVTVNVNSAIVISAGPDTSVCLGSQVQLNTDSGSAYQWSPGANLNDSSIADPIAILFATTTYTVTVSNGNCNGTATVTLTILPDPPAPTITQSHDTLYCSTDSTYKSYQWYNDSVIISGATDTILVVSQGGNYNVLVINENGCSVAVGTNVLLTGISSPVLGEASKIVFYPDPAKDQLTVSGEMFAESVLIEIYNMLGEKVYARQYEPQNAELETKIDVSLLAPGIYFMHVASKQNSTVIKFVKAQNDN